MDKLEKEKRSWNMSRVKSKNTKPELLIRSHLHKIGYRFRLHVKHLPGSPDIVFPKYRAVIFVHGCFWHRHIKCSAGNLPKTRSEFWQEKISENINRDQVAFTQLNLLGWRTAIVWECALKNKDETNDTVNKLYKWICSGPNNIELPSP